jgi:hypothetical protein
MNDITLETPHLDLCDFSHQAADSVLVFMTERAANLVEGYDLHRWLWQCRDSDVKDLYRALYRASVKVIERAVGDLDDPYLDLEGSGLYLDAEDTGEIRAYVVGVDHAVIQTARLYPDSTAAR